MEFVVDVEDVVRYPVGHRKWEYKKTIRTLSYRAKEFNKGDMFGHEEIYDNVRRRCTITSVNESEVMYINLKEFNKHFQTEYAREKLFEFFPRVDEEKIKEHIAQDDLTRK